MNRSLYRGSNGILNFMKLCGKSVANEPLEVPVKDISDYFKTFLNRESECPPLS